ncbi:uncharacterized protein LOC114517271 [Dendronephthya gigantea]|uniref:uncharacterized protein LOC114517271 n=1 Tax=Dendronephthya gigantea TaxID=151771 RepID=UPI00106D26ED|nr:uncharacterized protein LOC114517271 [Dendronephthya gigantea]XP_028392746.1 uncharacterized protein LOC114517271 [Dendronephthya gigantea]
MNQLKTASIVLKVVQIMALVVGIGFVAHFTKEAHDSLAKYLYELGRLGRFEFYLFTNGVGVAIAFFGLLCTLTGVLEKKFGAFGMITLQALWAFQLMVSTGLLTKILTIYRKKIFSQGMSKCEIWDRLYGLDNLEYDLHCSHLIVGVACGFIAMLLFAKDAVISFMFFRRFKESNLN